MNKMLYRYTSFESFVDSVLRKNLTFVHPSLWDDPYELSYFYQKIGDEFKKVKGKLDKDAYGAILEYIVANKLYAQAWTSLAESDALWRIYSYNGMSLRIAVKREKLKLLKDVEIIKVDYVKNYEEVISKKKDFYGLIGTKRKAFSHEKEFRLVKHYKFSDTKDAEEHIMAFLQLKKKEFFKEVEVDKIEEEIAKLIKKINYNIQDKIQYVSFDGIDDFIDSVMLNPLAPEWFNETMKVFCKNNNLRYLGKSDLYSDS